jgi:opacity protein-like surface antigen
MKRTKTFLLAAAVSLASTGAFAALVQDVTIDLTGSSDFSVAHGTERIIQQEYGSTYSGRLLSQGVTKWNDMTDRLGYLFTPEEMGIIRIRGTGVLEYRGWVTELNAHDPGFNGGFYFGRVFNYTRSPTYIFDPVSPGKTAP